MKEDTRKDIKWKSFFAHNHRYADVIASYTNSKELVKAKAYQEGGKTDMCKAIRDLMEDSRAEGIVQGIEQGIKIVASQLIKNGTLTIEEIAKCCQLSVEEIRDLCVETGCQNPKAKNYAG